MSRILFKGGSNFPGRVALKLDRSLLKTVARNYSVILVTGTNGKTTTNSMIYHMLKADQKKVITNHTGANMLPGITACFIENFSFRKPKQQQYATIEADEANVRLITDQISPSIITVTNLFRDQLDRYGEVYTTLKKILEGIEKSPSSTLVLNGDESLLGDLPSKNKKLYFGFDCGISEQKKIDINADAKFCKKCKTPYNYHFLTYNHLGNFFCPNCGYERPTLDYAVNEIFETSPTGSQVVIDKREYYINQPGTYNIYNALCAYSVAKALDISHGAIFNALKSQESRFGRQETLEINDKTVRIILVKNPAGYDEALRTIKLDTQKMDIAFLLNDNYADGRDVSWIWDVQFEQLKDCLIDRVLISGIRLYDMAVRLKVAGLQEKQFLPSESYDKLLEEIAKGTTNKVYILATYTAMIQFRKFLHSKGYIKNLW